MIKKKLRKSLSLPQDFGIFNSNLPTSIFQEIYNKTKANENKNITEINKTEEFLNLIEQIRIKEEMIETDKEYIIKESRKEIKFNQEMLFLFGKNKNNSKSTKKIGKIKLDKKIFLNPREKNEKKHFFSKCKSNFNILKLPIITNKNHLLIKRKNVFNPQNKYFNSDGNKHILNLNDSDSNSNRDISTKIINTNFTCNSQNNKKIKKKINSFLINSSSRKCQKTEGLSSKADTLRQNNNSSDINKLNDIIINKKVRQPVINLLDNINEELNTDKKKFKNYFLKNDYGCEMSKFKINYLEKHFFQ